MINFVSILLIIISLLSIYKISFDNILRSNTSYTLSFCTIYVIFFIISNLSDLFFLKINPIIFCAFIGIIFLIFTIKYSKHFNILHIKHLLFSFTIAIIMTIYSCRYLHNISLTGELDTIKYLGFFTNNKYIFYSFFHNIFKILDLNAQLNTIPLFTNTLVFLFHFLLLDSLYVYANNKPEKIIGLLSYFILLVSFATLKFSYINYMWIIFPINAIFNNIFQKEINTIKSILISIMYTSIMIILQNDIIIAIIICILLLFITELSVQIYNNKYKFILSFFICTLIYFDIKNVLFYAILVAFLQFFAIINKTKFKKVIYLLTITTLISLIIIKCEFNYFNLYTLNNSNILIDFINVNSNKFFIILLYLFLLLICLVKLKHTNKFFKQLLITFLIVFNPFLLYILSSRFQYCYILLFLLFNPQIIGDLFSYSYKVINLHKSHNNFIICVLILIAFSSSSILYPNIYDKYNYSDNKIHRMSEEELNIYKFALDNNIKIDGNIISQAPNTTAYLSNITLLNDYYYYIQLPSKPISDAPNNLTNIFSLRQYADTEYFNQERKFEESVEQLKFNNYNYLILRKDQSFQIDNYYFPLYLFYKNNNYDILYENDTYALLKTK